MPKNYFSINNYSQEFSIEPTAIMSQGGAASPYLLIPLSLDLAPQGMDTNDKIPFIITNIEADLLFDGFQYKTTEINKTCNLDVFQKRNWSYTLAFPLDQHKIFIIEKKRKSNLVFTMNITFHYGLYTSIALNTKDGSITKDFVSQYREDHRNITIEIPHSHWVNRILPGLGFKAFKLIEMPEHSEVIPEEFKQSLAELDEATKYFNSGDYDKSVGHCRSALDPYKGKMKDIKEFIKSKSEFTLIDEVSQSTLSWLDVVFNNLQRVSSKPHHPPTMGHFDRHEAQIIYMITTAVVAYIGKVDKPK